MLPPLCISQALVYFLRKNTKHLALDFIITKNEFDNVSARVVIASLGIFRKAADQVLKYIPSLRCRLFLDSGRAQRTPSQQQAGGYSCPSL
jgi:hypothetical protein